MDIFASSNTFFFLKATQYRDLLFHILVQKSYNDVILTCDVRCMQGDLLLWHFIGHMSVMIEVAVVEIITLYLVRTGRI